PVGCARPPVIVELVGHADHVAGVTFLGPCPLLPREQLSCTLTQQLEQTEAPLTFPRAGDAPHEALVDKAAQRTDDVGALLVRADGLYGLHRDGGAEDAHPCEQSPLLVTEELETPVDHRRDGLLTGGG